MPSFPPSAGPRRGGRRSARGALHAGARQPRHARQAAARLHLVRARALVAQRRPPLSRAATVLGPPDGQQGALCAAHGRGDDGTGTGTGTDYIDCFRAKGRWKVNGRQVPCCHAKAIWLLNILVLL
jgi:hypothetical protein